MVRTVKHILSGYRVGLTELYPDDLRLHDYVVIAIEFERLVWVELTLRLNSDRGKRQI